MSKRIPVTEFFGPTIQGEGLMTGTITDFLRTGGCPLRCTWCDSMDSVLPDVIKSTANYMTTTEIVSMLLARPTKAPWLTLTGGDPCMHKDLRDIILPMNGMGTRVAVETQGTLFPDWLTAVDVVTFSPKGPSSGNVVDPKMLLNWLSEHALGKRKFQVCVKVVCANKEDIDYALNLYRLLPETAVDQFWFNSCTPPFDPKTLPKDRIYDLQMQFHLLVEYMLGYFINEQLPLSDKVRVGFQEHVFIWPHAEKGV